MREYIRDHASSRCGVEYLRLVDLDESHIGDQENDGHIQNKLGAQKPTRANISEGRIQLALDSVNNKNCSIRAAAETYGLTKSLIHKRLKKHNLNENCNEAVASGIPLASYSFYSKYNSQQIFTKEQENIDEQVTFVGIVAATGETFSPVYIFPRARYKKDFLNGAPLGNIVLTIPSGWMTKEGFFGGHTATVTDMLQKDDDGIPRSQYSVQKESNKIKNSLEATDLPSTSSLAVQITPKMIIPFPKAQNDAMEKQYEEKRRRNLPNWKSLANKMQQEQNTISEYCVMARLESMPSIEFIASY
ncbi:hypothetical protein ILUMI_16636 [Ignelater luminosus]|uniref:HTH psq-type domain-containing protein n=1 Tax=Ignelater luminosus TaxID=2038154 RepID=A0A8K0CSJ6_IGNLU|nr:hypothetical protein ILUMI_16636 [Ignelater luminosus]